MSEELKDKAHQDLDKLDNFLDGYEKQIGLNGLNESDVAKYLNMTSEVLNKMSPEECLEASYILHKEALFVQHEVNKYQAQMDWAKARLNRTVAADLNNYGGRFATFETRVILAVKSNGYAQQLQKIIDKAERIITRLSYIPNNLRNIATVLSDYRRNKNNEVARNN